MTVKLDTINISDNKVSKKDFKKLHGFFWLFTLDLNSSKKDVQNILLKWFKKYHNYNANSWEVDLLSKRIVSWISNTKITYEGSDEIYKNEFDYLISDIDKEYSSYDNLDEIGTPSRGQESPFDEIKK